MYALHGARVPCDHFVRMMMKGMYRVALMLGLAAASALNVEAAEYQGSDEITTGVYVMNDHLADVRV
ncbi:MAG: hypothetical protein P8L45_12140 [Longimicrobiales bacterium]|nr:hypothetical protein [Longimicrobiales bacterium]